MKNRLPGNSQATFPYSGFTLIELVVAMGVFALIAMLAYGGLASVLDSKEFADQKAEQLARLQFAYRLMEQDLQQIVKRGIRTEYGDQVGPLLVGADSERALEFTRAGWRNPAGQLRSSLQRAAYSIREESLVRESWNVLDRAQDSKPREQKLLEDLQEFHVRLLDVQDQWQETWPPLANGVDDQEKDEDEVDLPKAIEITLKLEDFGTVTWLFQTNP